MSAFSRERSSIEANLNMESNGGVLPLHETAPNPGVECPLCGETRASD